jgi:DNA-binding CsgD family transcriptional regulator
MIRAVINASKNQTFQRSFLIVLVAELVTISLAWGLLNLNIGLWFHGEATKLVRISQRAASAADWSQMDKIPKDQESKLGDAYQGRLSKVSDRYFTGKEGSIFLALVERGEEYDVYSGNDIPVQDAGKANQWAVNAYATQQTTYSPRPIVDDMGTYLAAYTPITRNGRVIGLVAAELDEAPSSSFRNALQTAFLYSIIPAFLASLIVAYILATKFVAPAEVLRTIEETAQKLRAGSPEDEKRWNDLSEKEKKIAELLRQGVESTKDLAEEMDLKPSTIDTYFKRIKEKTTWSRHALALQAAARRSASEASTLGLA